MFSGIIEKLVTVSQIEREGTNIHFTLKSDIADELKVDQSVAHNGVCLTVTKIISDTYTVTAIRETLNLTNLGSLKIGDLVNIERCLKLSDRLDGHIVQGHVDGTAMLESVKDLDGSWVFRFTHNLDHRLILHKGSITLNGVSLTVTHTDKNHVEVNIIPYTYEHTNFHTLSPGDLVNVELDVLGKYMLNFIK